MADARLFARICIIRAIKSPRNRFHDTPAAFRGGNRERNIPLLYPIANIAVNIAASESSRGR